MITRENLRDIIKSLSNSAKKRILNSSKEYVVLYLHVFNTGSYVTIRLTDNYNRYKNVSKNGNVILYTEEVQNIINEMM